MVWVHFRMNRSLSRFQRVLPLLLLLVFPRLCAQQPGPTRKETIVVTGVFEPLPLEEADRCVVLLDVADKALLSNTLVDVLRLDPSVDLRERGPNDTQTDVSIRGGTFAQTLVLLDGWRLNDAQTAHHNMDVPVPPESLSRIEVLHGSGSTLYGSDAVGGAINLVTRTPQVSGFRLRTAFGNFGVNQQRTDLSVAWNKLAEEFAFSRDFSSGFRPDRDYRDLAFASVTHLSTSLGSTELLFAHNDRPFGADRFYGNFDSWERTGTVFAGVRQEVGKENEVSFAFRRHTDLFVLLRDNPGFCANHHAVEGYQAAWRHRQQLFENGRLFAGVEGYSDEIVSNNLGNHTRNRLAGYLALDVRALRRFSFSLGAREEIYGAGHGEFSPSLNGGYWVNHHLKLRAGISHAFRLPSFTDLYYYDPATLGSPTLRPERAWTYEAGLDWNAGGRLTGEMTLFERRDLDGIDYVRYSPTDLWRATNIQRLRFRGVEASLGVPFVRSQKLVVSYTGLQGSKAPLGIVESRYLFNYPAHSAVVSWQGPLPGGLEARSRVGMLQRVGQDPYTLWDVYLVRAWGRISPFLQLTNLTNTSYEEISGVPMPGRAIVAGVEVSVFSRKK